MCGGVRVSVGDVWMHVCVCVCVGRMCVCVCVCVCVCREKGRCIHSAQKAKHNVPDADFMYHMYHVI